jgi:hypothetical protein
MTDLVTEKYCPARESFSRLVASYLHEPPKDGGRNAENPAMALYMKNIGGVQQIARVALGLAAAAAAVALLAPPISYLVAFAGLMLAATGFVGYCPMGAVIGVGSRR